MGRGHRYSQEFSSRSMTRCPCLEGSKNDGDWVLCYNQLLSVCQHDQENQQHTQYPLHQNMRAFIAPGRARFYSRGAELHPENQERLRDVQPRSLHTRVLPWVCRQNESIPLACGEVVRLPMPWSPAAWCHYSIHPKSVINGENNIHEHSFCIHTGTSSEEHEYV